MIFSTNSGGMPRNADLLPFDLGILTPRYRTVRNGTAYSWEGIIECHEVDNDRPPTETWNGAINWRKFSLKMDTELYFWFGYANGDAYSFDYGVFVLSDELKSHLGLPIEV